MVANDSQYLKVIMHAVVEKAEQYNLLKSLVSHSSMCETLI